MPGELVFITGATGHVGFAVLVAALKAGYRVRASVRRQEQAQRLKAHKSVESFVNQLEFVTVPDITVDGAFDGVLDGVVYIQHIASPIPTLGVDPEADIIKPAIHGTLGILKSALNFKSVRRVVITSSMAAVTAAEALSRGDSENIYTADSRVKPLPTGPWTDLGSAYRAAKVLALDATDRFLAEANPFFSIINIMPAYVIGANELVTDANKVATGSNRLVMSIVLGEKFPVARPCAVVHVQDVARVHIQALDEHGSPGNKNFVLESGKMAFDDALDIVNEAFPDKVRDGTLPLGGSISPVYIRFDVAESLKTFGPLSSFKEQVTSVVTHYLSLIGEEKI